MITNALVYRLKEVIDSPDLDPYKSENFDEWLPVYQDLELEQYTNLKSKMAQGSMGLWQDRTRTIPHYLKLAGWEPLPEVNSSFNKSWKTICLETAEAIVKRANGQKINISWSGGLDSTCTFFALLEVAGPAQLKIFCNYHSILESGPLFDTYVRGNNIDFDITTPVVNPEFGEGLIVTGYLGDQLYGRYQTLNPEHFTMPWKDFITPKQVEFVERILPNWPGQELRTVPDFLNFIELNCKWQMGKTNRMRNMPKEIADRIINFYETEDFQKWSLGNYEPKWYNEDLRTYKYSTRLFLRDLMKSDIYAMNKAVQTSHYHILQHDWVMMLEDGTNLYTKDFKLS
jgi:hypothetical protein